MLTALVKAGRLAEMTTFFEDIVNTSKFKEFALNIKNQLGKEKLVELIVKLSKMPVDEVKKMFNQMRFWSPKKIAAWLKDSTKNYFVDGWQSPYKSGFIYKITEKPPARKVVSNWVLSPIATATGSTRQLTMPAGFATSFLMEEGYHNYLNSKQTKNFEAASKLALNLPGGERVLEYAQEGVVSPTAITRTVFKHRANLRKWTQSPNEYLPKVRNL